jgi:DNA polymerase eta
MDLTPMAIKQMLKTFPHLAIVPPDAPEGLDTPLPPPPPVDWSGSNVIPLNGQKKAETGGTARLRLRTRSRTCLPPGKTGLCALEPRS